MRPAYNPALPARPRQRRRRGRFILPVLGLMLFALAAWLGFQQVFKAIAWHFLKVERVDYGVLEDILPLEVFIAREEEVLVAPATGALVPVVPEGERVPVGATIARVLPVAAAPPGQGPLEIKASFPGQVSYHTDGLEKALQPASLGNINYQELKRLVELAGPVTAEGQIKAGTAIGRLVNNLAPLAVYAPLEDFPAGWQAGKRVNLKLPGSGDEVRASITRLQDEGRQKAVLMTIASWDERWLKPRRLEVAAVLNRYRGIILPAAALSSGPGGAKGVYLLGDRGIKWQPVSIEGQVGDRVAVRGLEAGTEVVVTPGLVRWLRE
ncbi:HlyD family efflux transporter periplasmic adaptor subunit [Neomoorella mulderi]|uniref:HlyD family secretion protein n=1 Tax=Moorella mulderi DSM 14980 TaxID=1122241 RepID=A0A151AY51_9FIRM|nr:HlyD family efflux transporter periplasmic adaptor subunit [Moorella mulderi]KYH32578.1 HlyD family secretion protein [Moorella mulderi DSM 14980]